MTIERARREIYIMGDFNRRVGKTDSVYTTVIRKTTETKHGSSGKNIETKVSEKCKNNSNIKLLHHENMKLYRIKDKRLRKYEEAVKIKINRCLQKWIHKSSGKYSREPQQEQ